MSIFIVLGLIHIYWAMGGKWAMEFTIPEAFKEGYFNEANKLKVSAATFVVALGLFLFAFITASNLEQFISIPYHKILSQIIASIFILRAIGDFKYVGIFKKKSASLFATKDNQIYISLCLYLGVSLFLIVYW